MRADPVASFIEKDLPKEMMSGTPLPVRVVYERFKDYCQDDLGKNQRYIPSRQTFLEGMEQNGFLTHEIVNTKHISRDMSKVSDKEKAKLVASSGDESWENL